MDKDSFKVKGKVIDHCYHQCPYFGIDGGPGPVMCCNHPKVNKLIKKNNDPSPAYIISHPICDIGFPELCPICYPGALEEKFKVATKICRDFKPVILPKFGQL
jgi:hypothetical protein